VSRGSEPAFDENFIDLKIPGDENYAESEKEL